MQHRPARSRQRFAFIAGVAAALIALAVPAAAQDAGAAISRAPILAVTGTGTYEAKPENATLTAEVETIADSLEKAVTAHKTAVARATAVLQKLETDGLQLGRSEFNLAPAPPPPGRADQREPATPRYRAATTFYLKLSRLDALDATIAQIADSGVLAVRGISYQVDDERRALNEARRAAVANAREQAEVLAAAAHVKLGDIIRIAGDQAYPDMERAAMPMAKALKVVPPATLSFSASVAMTWRIAP